MPNTKTPQIAESYVELTVAIVTLQDQVAMLARHHVAIGKNLDALTAVQQLQVELLKELLAQLGKAVER